MRKWLWFKDVRLYTILNFDHFLGTSPLTFHKVKDHGGGARRDGHRELPGGEERSTLASSGVVCVSLVNVARRRWPGGWFNPTAGVKIFGFRFFVFFLFVFFFRFFFRVFSGFSFFFGFSGVFLSPKVFFCSRRGGLCFFVPRFFLSHRGGGGVVPPGVFFCPPGCFFVPRGVFFQPGGVFFFLARGGAFCPSLGRCPSPSVFFFLESSPFFFWCPSPGFFFVSLLVFFVSLVFFLVSPFTIFFGGVLPVFLVPPSRFFGAPLPPPSRFFFGVPLPCVFCCPPPRGVFFVVLFPGECFLCPLPGGCFFVSSHRKEGSGVCVLAPGVVFVSPLFVSLLPRGGERGVCVPPISRGGVLCPPPPGVVFVPLLPGGPLGVSVLSVFFLCPSPSRGWCLCLSPWEVVFVSLPGEVVFVSLPLGGGVCVPPWGGGVCVFFGRWCLCSQCTVSVQRSVAQSACVLRALTTVCLFRTGEIVHVR